MPRRNLVAFFPLIGFAILMTGCGSSGGSGGPAVRTRNVNLNASQETTANSSAATGVATVTFAADGLSFTVVLVTTGLANASVTGAHIHAGLTGNAGLMGENAPVVFTLYSAADGAYAGSLNKTLTAANFTAQAGVGINTFTDAMNAILQGRAYINVHTSANPSGEIRGQILPNSFSATLNGAAEVPPSGAAGSGSAVVTINPATCQITVNSNTAGMDNSTVTLAHIHVGTASQAGPPIFTLYTTAEGSFLGVLNKTVTAANLTPQPGSGIDDCGDAINAIVTGRAYINIHSLAHPGGAIRGQLVATAGQ